MKCKLYLAYKDRVTRIGEFKSREVAEEFYNRHRQELGQIYGQQGKPIYVQGGKGRGK